MCIRDSALIVRHTDRKREWSYDRKANIGHLDKALDEAARKKWLVVDMKRDWKVVYPFQSTRCPNPQPASSRWPGS